MAAVQTAFDFFTSAPQRSAPRGPAQDTAQPNRAHRDLARDAAADTPVVVHATEHEAARARERVERTLSALMGRPVALTLTDNQRTMISARTRQGQNQVRLHHMFAHADEPTLRALARFLGFGDKLAGRHLERFVARNRAQIRTRVMRTTRLCARGRHHDLARLVEDLNDRYFEGRLEVSIGWARMGRAPGRRSRRHSIKLGSYHARDASIRIHPVLDAAWVPRFFVEFVIYHELLHHALGIPVREGRRQMHTPEFRRRERGFARYEEAISWEREHLERLLSS